MLDVLMPQSLLGLLGAASLFFLVISFYRDRFKFRIAHLQKRSLCQQPPRYPTWFPYFGSLIPFLLNGQDYLHKVS